jgi:hypothetical protein
MVKLEVATLPIVPDAPPEAGPDRALDPRPPAEPLPAAVAEGGVAVADDVPQPAITAHISAPVMIHRLLLFDSNRCTLGRRGCSATVAEADESGEDAGSPDIALETGRPGTVSWGLVGSLSFMTAFLLLRLLSREWQPFI